jgi:hypothetical protein
MEWDYDSGREVRKIANTIERNDLRALIRIIVLQDTSGRAETVVSVGKIEIDFENPHFENIAGLCLFDVHRASEKVTAGTPFADRHLFINRLERLLNVFRLRACCSKASGIARRSLN